MNHKPLETEVLPKPKEKSYAEHFSDCARIAWECAKHGDFDGFLQTLEIISFRAYDHGGKTALNAMRQ